MGSLYKFMNKDGIVKWGEISIMYCRRDVWEVDGRRDMRK